MTQTTAPTASPAAAPPPARRVWPRVLIALGIVLVLAIGAAAAYLVTIDRSVTSNLTRGVDLPSDDPSAAPGEARPTKEPQETGTLNYVLLGSDSRDPDNAGTGRSDSMMVVHLNASGQGLHHLVPAGHVRDHPGYGQNKINAAYAFGGAELTVATLEGLTRCRMDHVALVDFEGFIGLTDDLGGVTVINDDAVLRPHGYDYPEGWITISGEQALWFVRERKQLPSGDLDSGREPAQRDQGHRGRRPEWRRDVPDPAKFNRFIGNVAKTPDRGQQPDRRRDPADRAVAPAGRQDIDLMQAPISGFGTSRTARASTSSQHG